MRPPANPKGARNPLLASTPRARLDEVDIKILRFLCRDARLSQRAIARAVGMSPPAVSERIARLEASGVIEGYQAKVNYGALGRGMTVLVQVSADTSATQLELAQRLVEIPEIEQVDVVTGAADLMVRLHVHDQDQLSQILLDSVLSASTDVRKTETILALVTVRPDDFIGQLLDSVGEDLASGSSDQA